MTPPAAVAAPAATSPGPPGTARRSKPRRVIYKSTNLERTAPELVAFASAEAVSAVRAIQSANATAERVRDSYRSKRENTTTVGDAIVGSDEESNAKKYERRLKMNRQSAAASRVRREAYTKALEAELVNMESSYKELFAMLAKEREQSRRLREELETGGPGDFDDDDDDDSIAPAVGSAHPSNTSAPSTPLNSNVVMTEATPPADMALPPPMRAHALPPVPPAPSEKVALKTEAVEVGATVPAAPAFVPGGSSEPVGQAIPAHMGGTTQTQPGPSDVVRQAGATQPGAAASGSNAAGTTSENAGVGLEAMPAPGTNEDTGLVMSTELAQQLLLPDNLPLPECFFGTDPIGLSSLGGMTDDLLQFP